MHQKDTAYALEITNVHKVYDNGTEALKGVSLNIPTGDFYALLGPNGAGKTSMIGIATGLVRKSSGCVKVFGYDIDTHPEKAKSFIGLVGQEVNFNPFEKPIDIVVNQGGYYGIPRKTAIPRAEEVLNALGLYEKRFDNSLSLSGGMKRRLMIARALIHEPKLLILDEPTAGVDVELRRTMWEYLQTLTASGITILLTTHYLEEAEQLCKHVAIINKGDIIADGSMKHVLEQLKTEHMLLDFPQDINDDIVANLKNFNPLRVDGSTLQIEVSETHNINEAILILNTFGSPVKHARTKTGRLEELFVKLTSQ